ncbi:MAG TPA: DUF6468 domain-containing protein [Azospirillaceae bacterium]|nr:DUF6468 domain-containing protein [Azospirillaceae bacterium]
MTFDFSLLLDLVIVGLLVATITYAVILNRQLTQLRESRGELEMLVRGFAEATSRAEVGVKAMKKTAGEAGEALQSTIEKAHSLRDELQLIIETADSLANRLESATSGRGTAAAVSPPPRPAGQPLRPPPAAGVQPLSPTTSSMAPAPAQRPAVAAALGVLRGEPAPGHAARGDAPLRPPGYDDEDQEMPAKPASREEQEALTRAERELLQAIENMR